MTDLKIDELLETLPQRTGHRTRALELFARAEELFTEAVQEANRALGPEASHGLSLTEDTVSSLTSTYRDFQGRVRQQLDTRIWRQVLEEAGVDTLLSRQEHDKLQAQLREQPPEATRQALESRLRQMRSSSEASFEQSIRELYERLERLFRPSTGDGFRARLICAHAIDFMGLRQGWRDDLDDLERILCVLDGAPVPERTERISWVLRDEIPGVSATLRPGEWSNEYLHVQWFKKGSMHVRVLREDLLGRIDEVLEGTGGTSARAV